MSGEGLADFLLRMLAEDEVVALAAPGGEGWYIDAGQVWVLHDPNGDSASGLTDGEPIWAEGAWVHIARHDPARVLADVAAKRQIVEECRAMNEQGPSAAGLADIVLCALATIYADHPDHRPEWAI